MMDKESKFVSDASVATRFFHCNIIGYRSLQGQKRRTDVHKLQTLEAVYF